MAPAQKATLPTLTSEAYRITVDEGRETFYALSIEEVGNEEAWLMSDTVYALSEYR